MRWQDLGLLILPCFSTSLLWAGSTLTKLAITPGTPTNELLKADFDPFALPKGSLALLNVRDIPFLEVTRKVSLRLKTASL